MNDTIVTSNAITIEDVEYQPGMLARLYRPKGTGPFPAALQVHGGAWTSKDRTDNDFMAKAQDAVVSTIPGARTTAPAAERVAA